MGAGADVKSKGRRNPKTRERKMLQPRMMVALANSALRREIPWMVAVAVSVVALIALAEGYFA